ncbi:MAG TPA: O-antigen ligase family protein [Terriglobales bacterium]|nr:O-antigen ligase family protein [Terriglobales bacterium]
MGFVLTLLYVSFAYLSPAALFPELAQYRIQLILAICALLACVPELPRSRFGRTPQLYLLLGLTAAIATSNILAKRWFGGTLPALESFLPNAVPLVLIGLTCRNLRRLRILCVVLGCIAIYYIAVGARAYTAQDFQSAYILMQGELPRIRGFASLNDPNDLAQFIIILVALTWLLWRNGLSGKIGVLLFTAIFCFGIFLTHSRGATVALAAIVLFHFKDRVGAALSVVLAGGLFVLTKLLQFSGGRSISADSGADRMAAWGVGLQFFKSSPLFGIGFNQFAENYEITAHNSFVLCLAELGALGYFFWMALLVFTIMQLTAIMRADCTTGEPEGETPARRSNDAADVKRWARALRISMVGFLVAGWFLSRTYTITLYILLGMVIAVVRMSKSIELDQEKQPTVGLMLNRTMIFEALSIVAIYGLLRIRWLL